MCREGRREFVLWRNGYGGRQEWEREREREREKPRSRDKGREGGVRAGRAEGVGGSEQGGADACCQCCAVVSEGDNKENTREHILTREHIHTD